MTTGAAYDLAQTLGWKSSLSLSPTDAKKFYAALIVFMALALGVNFIGLNPMKVLVWAGIVQGLSTPPLMLMVMLMTNRSDVMGKNTNRLGINVLGWVTTALMFGVSGALLVSLL